MALKLSRSEIASIKRDAKASGSKSASERFIRYGGAKRNYLDTKTGLSYSNRAYRALGLNAETAAVRNTGEVKAYSAARKNQMIWRGRAQKTVTSTYIEAQAKQGKTITRSDALKSDEFKQLLKDRNARYKNGNPNYRKQLKSLKALGLRDDVPDWVRPGDTPKFRKAQLSGFPMADFEASYRKRLGRW